jgi:hypothetical protein
LICDLPRLGEALDRLAAAGIHYDMAAATV